MATELLAIPEDNLKEFIALLRIVLEDHEVTSDLHARLETWCDEESDYIDPDRFMPGTHVTVWHGDAQSKGVVVSHADTRGRYFVDSNTYGGWVDPDGDIVRMERTS